MRSDIEAEQSLRNFGMVRGCGIRGLGRFAACTLIWGDDRYSVRHFDIRFINEIDRACLVSPESRKRKAEGKDQGAFKEHMWTAQ